MTHKKLFLYSMQANDSQWQQFDQLVGKNPSSISMAVIENAMDNIPSAVHWMPSVRQELIQKGYQLDSIDLRQYQDKSNSDLESRLTSVDAIWVCGGNVYYLAWILKSTGADQIIKRLIAAGKVYAGWSAGAVIAGPTTQYFDAMGDDPKEAPELIHQGMAVIPNVIVPHMDHAEFGKAGHSINSKLVQDGFSTIPLNDDQVYVVDGENNYLI